jgi:adhesin transport system outer membrane protein
MKRRHWSIILPGAVLLSATPASAIDLREAVQSAIATNPQVHQAISNRVATQEERVQAQGLYYPRISVEARAGVEDLRNPTRRSLGIAGHTLWPVEGDLILDQLVFDSGGREAEIRRQAARTDAAAARVEERSEFVALNVSRAYIDYLLQQRLVAIAQDNVAFHEKLAGDLREGVSKGSISVADAQQAEERLQAARAKVTQAREDLETAAIDFQAVAGIPIDSATMPPDLSQALPASVNDAEEQARVNNPLVQEAIADLTAARENVSEAKSKLGPRFNIEARARAGHDIDGFEGKTTDLQALGVLRWDIFTGGINQANVREQQGRADEAHGRLFEQTRQAEQDARSAWSRLTNQAALTSELEAQSRISDDLLLSYREQFNVGRRSLLDVLDAQNSRYNVQAQVETARLAKLYAQYRVLAATNRLTEALGVNIPTAGYGGERAHYHVNPVPAADLMENSLQAPAMGPMAPAGGTPPPATPDETLTNPTGTPDQTTPPPAETPGR